MYSLHGNQKVEGLLKVSGSEIRRKTDNILEKVQDSDAFCCKTLTNINNIWPCVPTTMSDLQIFY